MKIGLMKIVVLLCTLELAHGLSECYAVELPKPPADRPLRISCLGDSITDGHTYPLLVQQALREAGKPVPTFLNAGFGGDTAEGMLKRLDADVFSRKPDLVLVSAGINDFGQGVSKDDYLARMNKIFDRLAEHKVPGMLLTMSAVRHGRSQQGLEERNEALRQMAKERELPLADVAAAFAPRAAAGEDLWEADGCHLNFAGYQAVARAVLDGLGYSSVAVPKEQVVEVEPGLITNWRVRPSPENKLLDAETIKSVQVDVSWKDYKLPEPDPGDGWWWEQERKRGFAIRLKKYIGEANLFQAVAEIDSPAKRKTYLRPGNSIRAIWLNGVKIHENPAPTWHTREEIEVELQPGKNTVLVEGDRFFLSVVDSKE